MRKVIIPSAKVAEDEIPNIGRVPAVIYPINEEIVFNYLLKQNKNYDIMNVVCYEQKEKVYNKLNQFLSDNIKIINLPKLGDLGYTIYNAIDENDDSITINFGDTIIYEENAIDIENDSFLYSFEYESNKWTFFEEKSGVINNIIDKKNILKKEPTKHKMFVGIFNIIHAQEFKKCLEEAFDIKNGTSSFYNAIQIYSKVNPLKAIETKKWFDVGHIDRYYESKLEVKSREFNHIKIDKDRGILIKTSDDVEKFIGEIKWYLKIPSDLEYVRPRIFKYDLSFEHPSVSMEYYAYNTVHELFLNGNLTYEQWISVFNRIKFICTDFKRYYVQDNNIKESLENMYLKKTIERLNKLRNNKNFEDLFERNILINGKRYKSLNEICQLLKNIIPSLYNVDRFYIIHGDLCFSNIMIDSNLSFIKVVDPRGKFGKYDIYGDYRYELAKLIHSVDGGYDYIIKDMFDLKYDSYNNSFEYKLNINERSFDLYDTFKKVFAEQLDFQKMREIELIESLLFLSMIPLHSESISHQFAMLCTGILILDRLYDIGDEKN